MLNVGDRIVNTFIYPIEGAYVMIDTGYDGMFQSRKKKLKKHNISIKEVKYIFLTHAHDDHAGFVNDMIQENPEIKVILSEKGLDMLRKGECSPGGGSSGKQAYYFCQILKLFVKGEHTFPPIKEEYEKNLWLYNQENKAEIEKVLQATILETSGHTKDSISLLTKNGDLFCGDAAMNGFPSKNNIIIWIEDKQEYQKSWAKIIESKSKLIYPAHGKPFPVKHLEKNMTHLEKVKIIP